MSSIRKITLLSFLLTATFISFPILNTYANKAILSSIVLLGGEDVSGNMANNVISFHQARRVQWNQIVNNAPWSPRSDHVSLFFQNKIWLLGGVDLNSNYFSDIWSSADGVNWNLATTNAWPKRIGHSVIEFNGNMLVIGGETKTRGPLGSLFPRVLNDVWLSPDGINWTNILDQAPWQARKNHAVVIFNNQIFIIGGQTLTRGNNRPGIPINPIFLNDVWKSSDGLNWTEVTNSAPWSRRSGHTAVVLNGKIFIMGGENNSAIPGFWFNDVWSSVDGVNWTQVSASAPWTSRASHSSLIFNGEMWVIGGANYSGSVPSAVFKDAWISPDGINWTLQTANIPNFFGKNSTAVVTR